MTELEKILYVAKLKMCDNKLKLNMFGRELEYISLDTALGILDSFKDYGYDYENMDQPEECVHGYGVCCYPISDCKNCPARPENNDQYFGITTCEFK